MAHVSNLPGVIEFRKLNSYEKEGVDAQQETGDAVAPQRIELLGRNSAKK